MALPSSGLISLNQVNVELKKTATATISMNDAAVRALAKVASGAVSMSNLHGKSSEVTFTNSTNRKGANIHTLMGKPTVANIYIFVNTATISAASVGSWALQTGTFPAGSTLKIINKGAIRGGGGKGGGMLNGDTSGGKAGGTALILNFPATIDNTSGTIWGGGGGGGNNGFTVGGGGAGIPGGTGHKTGSATAGGAGGNSSAGKGGAPGAAGGKGGTSAGRGGYSVQKNGNAVTWTAVGDRKGSVV